MTFSSVPFLFKLNILYFSLICLHLFVVCLHEIYEHMTQSILVFLELYSANTINTKLLNLASGRIFWSRAASSPLFAKIAQQSLGYKGVFKAIYW